MTNRLETLAPGLVAKIHDASLDKQRAAARVAAHLAVETSGLVDPSVEQALAALRDGKWGDTPERRAIGLLTDRLDARYFELQEHASEHPEVEGQYLKQFSQARASSAVGFALDSDALNAALESIYETHAAVGDLQSVVSAVERALRRS